MNDSLIVLEWAILEASNPVLTRNNVRSEPGFLSRGAMNTRKNWFMFDPYPFPPKKDKKGSPVHRRSCRPSRVSGAQGADVPSWECFQPDPGGNRMETRSCSMFFPINHPPTNCFSQHFPMELQKLYAFTYRSIGCFACFALVWPEPTTAPNWFVQIRAPHPSYCPRWHVLRDHDAFPGQDLGKVPISQLAEAKAGGFSMLSGWNAPVVFPSLGYRRRQKSLKFRETGRSGRHFAKEKL